jgi:hypothetical protein
MVLRIQDPRADHLTVLRDDVSAFLVPVPIAVEDDVIVVQLYLPMLFPRLSRHGTRLHPRQGRSNGPSTTLLLFQQRQHQSKDYKKCNDTGNHDQPGHKGTTSGLS